MDIQTDLQYMISDILFLFTLDKNLLNDWILVVFVAVEGIKTIVAKI
jgi:hypothetical protein